MATMGETTPASYKLELITAHGPVFRDVLRKPPRDCAPSEVPIIDVSGIWGDLESRKSLAATVREAAENTGFFYIKNHGIPRECTEAAFTQAKAFFAEGEETKRAVSTARSKWYNGWVEKHGTQASPSETRDYREGFGWRYDPQYDPDPKDLDAIPEDIKPWIRGEEFVWEGTSHLPGFKKYTIAYWQQCLTLARRMIRVFALALDLPETYFDSIVTYPGADGILNYYPRNEGQADASIDVGLGAHTDLQCFTFLWQDPVGGLQVLTKKGEWIKVPPVADTLVVNIGDFLMRLSNDRFKSTVHRVYNYAPMNRYSMALFFGFNFNEKCAVLPSCTGEGNPPKYAPITCGEWCQMRFEQGSKRKKLAQSSHNGES